MSTFDIRYFGDPGLRTPAEEVTKVDGALVKITEKMIATMYEAPGVGLAAPQVGIGKRLFVYDLHDGEGAKVLVNPVVKEARGEWVYDEGCLSVPGLSWEITRPKEIHLVGFDLEGNSIDVEADEFVARVYQHEMDHLEGRLLIDFLEPDMKAEALRTLRNRILEFGNAADPKAAAAKAEALAEEAAKAKPSKVSQATKNKFGITLPGLR